MNQIYIYLLICLMGVAIVSSECPNACSSHGKCGSYDQCTCYRNWLGNDCSQRICQFGVAHVDSPKGDLDASGGALTNSKTVVVENDQIYPFGTTEQYPEAVNSAGTYLDNTAHEYRECSNKGLCDRSTGTCQCFEGYEGSACQRASCPSNTNGVCSGHGTCQTIKEIAARDYDNVYYLWDEQTTLGCVCDPKYFGPDCSYKSCKYGFDPLYSESYQNVRYSNFTYQLYTEQDSAVLSGNYSLVFYDVYDHAWLTDPISWDASCDTVVSALEALPNNVVPYALCQKSSTNTDFQISFSDISIKSRYTIAFPENPGRLRQMSINIYLDGKRPTLYTNESSSTLGYHIYPNGFSGEFIDYVPTICSGVLVTLQNGTDYDILTAETAAQTKLLKSCLGGADSSSSNNVEVYNWDYGTVYNPHLIRLIDSTQDNTGINIVEFPQLEEYPVSNLCHSTTSFLDGYGYGWCKASDPPGFYVAMYYNGSDFLVINRPSGDYSTSTKFHVYTTSGYLQVVNNNSRAFTHTVAQSSSDVMKYGHSATLYLVNATTSYSDFYGQLDCSSVTTGDYGSFTCLNKDDFIFVMNERTTTAGHASNPRYLNMYQVKKAFQAPTSYAEDPSTATSVRFRYRLTLDYGLNSKYLYAGNQASYGDTSALVYKFVLPTSTDSYYEYAAQCSNRGICDYSTGICGCFKGHTSDDCSVQNALAV